MEPVEIFEHLKSHAIKDMNEILHIGFSLTDSPERSALEQGHLAFHYELSGEMEGDIVLFLEKDESKQVVKKFIEVTFGSETEIPGGVEGICQEIANIFIGRFTGFIYDRGLEINIEGPGKTHLPGAVMNQIPALKKGDGYLFAVVSTDNNNKGSMTFWSDFRKPQGTRK